MLSVIWLFGVSVSGMAKSEQRSWRQQQGRGLGRPKRADLRSRTGKVTSPLGHNLSASKLQILVSVVSIGSA